MSKLIDWIKKDRKLWIYWEIFGKWNKAHYMSKDIKLKIEEFKKKTLPQLMHQKATEEYQKKLHHSGVDQEEAMIILHSYVFDGLGHKEDILRVLHQVGTAIPESPDWDEQALEVKKGKRWRDRNLDKLVGLYAESSLITQNKIKPIRERNGWIKRLLGK